MTFTLLGFVDTQSQNHKVCRLRNLQRSMYTIYLQRVDLYTLAVRDWSTAILSPYGIGDRDDAVVGSVKTGLLNCVVGEQAGAGVALRPNDGCATRHIRPTVVK